MVREKITTSSLYATCLSLAIATAAELGSSRKSGVPHHILDDRSYSHRGSNLTSCARDASLTHGEKLSIGRAEARHRFHDGSDILDLVVHEIAHHNNCVRAQSIYCVRVSRDLQQERGQCTVITNTAVSWLASFVEQRFSLAKNRDSNE